MSLKIVSLASGSKGNATLILSDKTALLVDVGLSYSKLNSELRDFGFCVSSLEGIVITHEHADHIKGIERVSKECNIYAHRLTKEAILKREKAIETKCFIDVDDYMSGFLIGDIFVQPFRTSHDAAYPLAYTFVCGNARVSVLTDTGTVTKEIFDNIKDSEAILIEANHDRNMLINGPYPYPLKKRILSDEGHMSNCMCSKVVEKLAEYGITKKILLGHLSENNNIPGIAYDEVCGVLKNHEIEVYLTYQDRRSEVCEVL